MYIKPYDSYLCMFDFHFRSKGRYPTYIFFFYIVDINSFPYECSFYCFIYVASCFFFSMSLKTQPRSFFFRYSLSLTSSSSSFCFFYFVKFLSFYDCVIFIKMKSDDSFLPTSQISQQAKYKIKFVWDKSINESKKIKTFTACAWRGWKLTHKKKENCGKYLRNSP